jgi:hypothetical protein
VANLEKELGVGRLTPSPHAAQAESGHRRATWRFNIKIKKLTVRRFYDFFETNSAAAGFNVAKPSL